MGFIRDIIKNKYLYFLGLPGIVFLVIFGYLPMFGHLLAFQKFTFSGGFFGSAFVGLRNFEFFFGSNDWWRITFNTVFLNTLFISFGTVTAIALAILINEIRHRAIKRLVQSAVFLPYFISWLVVSLMVVGIFSSQGVLNRVLIALGGEPGAWYQIPEAWPGILTGISVWKFAGYNSIIYLAAVVGISPEYYESARMDGASRWHQITHITLPLISPIVIIMTLMAVGRVFFGDFGMIYGIVGDQPVLYDSTDVIDTYTFRALRTLGNFSMTSAIALYQSVMGLVLILVSNAFVKRIDRDQGLF